MKDETVTVTEWKITGMVIDGMPVVDGWIEDLGLWGRLDYKRQVIQVARVNKDTGEVGLACLPFRSQVAA